MGGKRTDSPLFPGMESIGVAAVATDYVSFGFNESAAVPTPLVMVPPR